MKKVFILLAFCSFFVAATAQEHHDTTLKNNVRLVLTPWLLTGQLGSFTVGYERMLKKNQSMSFGLGHLQMPTIITTPEGNPVKWISNLRNTGFLVTFDYRFYFSRNKYAKPDGLYWAPYFTYHYIDNKARIELVNSDQIYVEEDLQLYANLAMVGVQIGYQFVLGNRWTVDLILLGPGIGYYDFTLLLDADAQITGDENYIQGIYDALTSLFPGSSTLFGEQRLDDSGRIHFGGGAFRYGFQVGYRF